MRLSEFKKEVRCLGLTHSGEKRTIYVSEGHDTCASVSLHTPYVAWLSVESIKSESIRAKLISLIAEFASTPLADRYERVVAKHENGSYVRELTVMMTGRPALEVEMTNDISEANDGISACERDWLDDFFGDKISYIEEY